MIGSDAMRSPGRPDSIFVPKDQNTFWVLLKDQKNVAPQFERTEASDYLYRISLSSGREQLIKCYFELNDQFLFCYKEQSKTLVAYLDLEYARIKEIQHRDSSSGKVYHGIRIIRHRNYEDLLSDDEAVIRRWMGLFKKHCIMSQFGLFYENVRVLGQGNFAKVFLVKRKSDGKEFAAKVFDKKAILREPLEKKCLVYEITILRSLSNANVMKMYELYEGQNYVYCLLEPYYGDQLLKKILKKGRFSERESTELIYRVLKGLAYLESKDIIHRDLKPENVIFRSPEDQHEVVLVDFGFSTKVRDFKNLFTRCGTPGYVAPEVLNDEDYTTKADCFSAGIIYYILLTGCAPFYGDSYNDVVEKNLKGELNYNFEEINLHLEDATMDLLQSLLQKDPVERISASEALKHPAFEKIVAAEAEETMGDTEETNIEENASIPNFPDFQNRYKFNTKKFPKATIPDSINELNTPMLSADARVIRPIAKMPGITPLLVGRKLNKTQLNQKKMEALSKPGLGSIAEKKGEEEDKGPKAVKGSGMMKYMRKFE